MFIRRKVVKSITYYQAVEGYRDAADKVRHRTVASLGRYPTPQEAITAARRELRPLEGLLAKQEPFAARFKSAARKVEWLRSRIDTLTRQLERLEVARSSLES